MGKNEVNHKYSIVEITVYRVVDGREIPTYLLRAVCLLKSINLFGYVVHHHEYTLVYVRVDLVDSCLNVHSIMSD
jgi:hypothetical protein